ncbi:hypothetical protein P691DRAFT_810479 [Macrolepiota fuliginosa MF-IS2]|uniref:Uncharacterized protein n=1 Tax=Macrolepiota fuliginosa MF-IS2 TaxID=1400762 RepID=A0A9P5X384_9AGAR|nr:hypothetical protein P691DRAFT_810479 [Macrolepiota fuliginosa MF-IS2]
MDSLSVGAGVIRAIFGVLLGGSVLPNPPANPFTYHIAINIFRHISLVKLWNINYLFILVIHSQKKLLSPTDRMRF